MKNKRNITIFTCIIIIIFIVILVTIQSKESEKVTLLNNKSVNSPKRAVIIKIQDSTIMAMEIESYKPIFDIMLTNDLEIKYTESNNLLNINLNQNEINKFALGQEILIYFNEEKVKFNFPIEISDIEKIEILKEKSNLEIPDSLLRYCYSSIDNISISISDFTKSGLSLTITDSNEYPLVYDLTNYEILTKNKENGNYEVLKDFNVPIQDTIVYSNIINKNTYTWSIDWSKIYDNLKEGGYRLKIQFFCQEVYIDFTINESGNLSYNEAIIKSLLIR